MISTRGILYLQRFIFTTFVCCSWDRLQRYSVSLIIFGFLNDFFLLCNSDIRNGSVEQSVDDSHTRIAVVARSNIHDFHPL